METKQDNGIIDVASPHSVEETLARLLKLLDSKGITVFALIDHSGEAAKVGMSMLSSKLLIFGSPNMGTPLMVACPSVALDLPLKVLVHQDENGGVWLSYNSPSYLQTRHLLPNDLLKNIQGLASLVAAAAARDPETTESLG